MGTDALDRPGAIQPFAKPLRKVKVAVVGKEGQGGEGPYKQASRDLDDNG